MKYLICFIIIALVGCNGTVSSFVRDGGGARGGNSTSPSLAPVNKSYLELTSGQGRLVSGDLTLDISTNVKHKTLSSGNVKLILDINHHQISYQ